MNGSIEYVFLCVVRLWENCLRMSVRRFSLDQTDKPLVVAHRDSKCIDPLLASTYKIHTLPKVNTFNFLINKALNDFIVLFHKGLFITDLIGSATTLRVLEKFWNIYASHFLSTTMILFKWHYGTTWQKFDFFQKILLLMLMLVLLQSFSCNQGLIIAF